MRASALAVALLAFTCAVAFVGVADASAQQTGLAADDRLGQARELVAGGELARKARDLRKAIELYERALMLGEAALGREHPALVPMIDTLGVLHRDTASYASALVYFARSLDIDEKARGTEHLDVARDLTNLAGVYESMGAYVKAIPLSQRSLAIREQALGPNHPDVAKSLNNLATLYQAMSDYARAMPLYQRSLAIVQKALGPDHPNVARSLNNLAGLSDAIGDYPRAVSLYQRGLAIAEKALGSEHPDVATLLNNLAESYRAMGDYAKVLPLHQRSLGIREKALGREHPDTATSLNNLAGTYGQMGDYANALPLHQRSLAVGEKVLGPEHPDVATDLNNLAGLYREMGDYAMALAHYRRSLEIYEKAFGPQHPDVATGLSNLAGLYESMGDYTRALPLHQRGLAIREKALGPGHPDVASSLNNLAAWHQGRSDHPTALLLHQRSLAIAEKAFGPEHPNVARSLNNLAVSYAASGDDVKALALSQRGLAIREKALGPEHPEVAVSLHSLASLYRRRGDFAKALPLFQRALRIASAAPAPETVWRVEAGLRRLLAQEGHTELAIFFGKQAVNSIQGLRGRLTGLDLDLQRSFLIDKENVYRDLSGLLIAQGRLAEAQQVLSMLKEEELFEFIRRNSAEDRRKTIASYVGLETRFAERFRTLREGISGVAGELYTLDRRARIGLDETDRQRLAQLRTQRAHHQAQFDAFLKDIFVEMSGSRGRVADAQGAAEHLATLRQMLASLGGGTVLLHYVVLDDRTHVILTTPTVQLVREAKVGAAELNRRIHEYRQVLQDPRRDPLPAAKELYGLLIGPVADDLAKANAQTLMLALDGTLRYLPLAAVHDGERYLAERFRLVLFTDAVRERLTEAPIAKWHMTALGVTREVPGFSPLPAVRQELEGILSAGGIAGEAHLDEAFTAERLRSSLTSKRPVMHIASHFVFTPGTDADSFLLLGDGSRLTLADMKTFSFEGIDLITLSACDTALGGGRNARGEEIEGFGALAQRQGAKGVLASLWPVADQSTGEFMQAFYRTRQATPGMSKAEALRQAQLRFIRDGTRGYAHPFYWAPFILMGNWL